MDASQRGAIYFLARPFLWLVVLLATVAVIVAGLVFLRVTGWALTAFPAAAVELGSGGRAPTEWLAISPRHGACRMALRHWRSGVGRRWHLLLVFGAGFSLVGGALTRAYLLLREACDGQPVDERGLFRIPPMSPTCRARTPPRNARRERAA